MRSSIIAVLLALATVSGFFTAATIASAQSCPAGQIYSPNFLKCIEDKGYDFSGYKSDALTKPTGNGTLNNPTSPGSLNRPTNPGSYFEDLGGNSRSSSGSGCKSDGKTLCNPLKSDSLTGFLLDLIDILILFAIPLIILMIIYSGFMYVIARGNEEKVTTATRSLTYAVIGGLLILGAKLLLEIIQGTVDQLVQ